MSFQEVDLVNLFLKCYKAIENLNRQVTGTEDVDNILAVRPFAI